MISESDLPIYLRRRQIIPSPPSRSSANQNRRRIRTLCARTNHGWTYRSRIVTIDLTGNGLILPCAPAAPITEPELGLQRQVLVHSAAMMLVRHQMQKGWHGTAHRHLHEQMVYVISG